MRQYFLLPLLAMALLTGCRHSTQSTQQDSGTEQGEEQKDVKRNVVRRQLPMPSEFNYLTNLGNVDIIYTQGEYHLEVEGDSVLLEQLTTNFDSNLLTVSLGADGNPDFNKYGSTSRVTMYLSCPDLACVSICGNGSFESRGTWTEPDLQLGMLHNGTMTLEHVECGTFALQVSAEGTVTLGNLHANEATIMSRSAASIKANVDVDELTVMNENKTKLHVTGRANHALFSHPNDPNLVNELE